MGAVFPYKVSYGDGVTDSRLLYRFQNYVLYGNVWRQVAQFGSFTKSANRITPLIVYLFLTKKITYNIFFS
jgi:hypothetical protein